MLAFSRSIAWVLAHHPSSGVPTSWRSPPGVAGRGSRSRTAVWGQPFKTAHPRSSGEWLCWANRGRVRGKRAVNEARPRWAGWALARLGPRASDRARRTGAPILGRGAPCAAPRAHKSCVTSAPWAPPDRRVVCGGGGSPTLAPAVQRALGSHRQRPFPGQLWVRCTVLQPGSMFRRRQPVVRQQSEAPPSPAHSETQLAADDAASVQVTNRSIAEGVQA